jgi:hypothetical protein
MEARMRSGHREQIDHLGEVEKVHRVDILIPELRLNTGHLLDSSDPISTLPPPFTTSPTTFFGFSASEQFIFI